MNATAIYRMGKAIRIAAEQMQSGRTAFEAIELIRQEAPIFEQMNESCKQFGRLCGPNVRPTFWAEELIILVSSIAELAGIYEHAWGKASELLYPTRVPTDASRVRETLISLAVKPDSETLIAPCLPGSPLPVARD